MDRATCAKLNAAVNENKYFNVSANFAQRLVAAIHVNSFKQKFKQILPKSDDSSSGIVLTLNFLVVQYLSYFG